MHKIIAFGFIALNTLLLQPLPTQAQKTFNLSGEWVWAGDSVVGSSTGCTRSRSGGTYTANGIQNGDTFEIPVTITQSANQLKISDQSVSNSAGNYVIISTGKVSSNQVTIESNGGGLNNVFQGKINENGNVITGLTTCHYQGRTGTDTVFAVLYRKTFCSAQPISITELRSLQAQKPSLQQMSRLS